MRPPYVSFHLGSCAEANPSFAEGFREGMAADRDIFAPQRVERSHWCQILLVLLGPVLPDRCLGCAQCPKRYRRFALEKLLAACLHQANLKISDMDIYEAGLHLEPW